MSRTLDKRIAYLESSARQPTRNDGSPGDVPGLVAKLEAMTTAQDREHERRSRLPLDAQLELLDRDHSAEVAERARRRPRPDLVPTAIDDLADRVYAVSRSALVRRLDAAEPGGA